MICTVIQFKQCDSLKTIIFIEWFQKFAISTLLFLAVYDSNTKYISSDMVLCKITVQKLLNQTNSSHLAVENNIPIHAQEVLKPVYFS